MRRIERNRAGFSLLEALITVSVGMVIATTAIPNMNNGIANIRLRSSMSSLSGVLQNCRMLAVKNNRTMSTHFQATSYGVMAYVKRASDSSSLGTGDSQVQLQAPVTRMTAPAGPDAPAATAPSGTDWSNRLHYSAEGDHATTFRHRIGPTKSHPSRPGRHDPRRQRHCRCLLAGSV